MKPLHITKVTFFIKNNKILMKRMALAYIFSNSLMSGLIENSWLLLSASVFSLVL